MVQGRRWAPSMPCAILPWWAVLLLRHKSRRRCWHPTPSWRLDIKWIGGCKQLTNVCMGLYSYMHTPTGCMCSVKFFWKWCQWVFSSVCGFPLLLQPLRVDVYCVFCTTKPSMLPFKNLLALVTALYGHCCTFNTTSTSSLGALHLCLRK